MRLSIFSFLASVLATPALALTFQTPLEHVEWTVEGDRFECRLEIGRASCRERV